MVAVLLSGVVLTMAGFVYLLLGASARISKESGLPLHGAVPSFRGENTREINERVAKADADTLARFARHRPIAAAVTALGLALIIIGAIVG